MKVWANSTCELYCQVNIAFCPDSGLKMWFRCINFIHLVKERLQEIVT